MLTGLFLLANLPVRGQCDPSVLQVVDNERPVRFSVLIEEGKASLNDFIRVRSATGGEFEVKADALRDERTGKTIAANRITLTPTKFSIAKGDSEELGLEIAELEQTGLFTGQLFITNQADSCNIIIPLEVEVVADGQLSVLESDRNLEVRFVSPSWLNGLIPHKIRHQGLHFRIENTGDSPVEIEDFTLSLKGNSTKQVLSEKDFNWGDEKKVVAPQKIQTIRLPLANQMKIDADEYDGLLRLYFNGALKPMTLTVTLYTRIGVAGAILALLLGIAVGRMMKDVNKAQDQLEVMDRFIPLRARAEKLTDQPTKELLKTEMDEIEAKINKVTDAAGREALEERLNGLERKIIQLEHFFLLLSNTLERMKEEGIDRDRYNKEIHPKFVLLRTAILEGKEEESKKVLAELKNAITELYNESRDVLDKGSTSEVEAEMKKVMDSFTVVDAKTSTAPLSTGEKVEKWALRILNFIAGVKVTARVRYGLFRPLVSLATFLVIVLLGFQEIYVNGGDTFGVDGIYDYLKLFLWGVVSDVFSRTLIGNSSVDTFMAKPTQS
ncbi:MAG: hypothetical protein DHS20C18_46280 [Saprospiraceae bacterium]|nr:MAG: hypothetical protein DHS20C18_46280 [Saprospiraceae bacterium]